MYKDTFIAMVRATKQMPRAVQTDYFKGYKEFDAWLSLMGVKMEQPKKGNARAKVVEGVLGHITNEIERYSPAFNGLNATAKEGRISDDFRDTVAMPNALSWKEAKVYVEQITMQTWNNHVMQTLDYKPCGKMPVELFLEKSKSEFALSADRFVCIAGYHHCVRLGLQGLQVCSAGYTYFFVPDFEAWGADKIAEWMLVNRGKQFNIYLQNYEGQALVFEVETTKKVGWFVRKGEAEYSPDLLSKEGAQVLGQSEAVRKAQLKLAKKKLKDAQLAYPSALENMQNFTQNTQNIELHKGMLVDTRTGEVLKGSTDKDELNDAEESLKMGDAVEEYVATTKKTKKTTLPEAEGLEGAEGVDWAWVEHPTEVGKFVRTYNKANF